MQKLGHFDLHKLAQSQYKIIEKRSFVIGIIMDIVMMVHADFESL